MTIAFKALQCPQCSGRCLVWHCGNGEVRGVTTVTLEMRPFVAKDFLDAWLRLCELQRNARSGRQLPTDTHTYGRVHSIFNSHRFSVRPRIVRQPIHSASYCTLQFDAATTARLLRGWSVHQHFQADAGTSAAMLRLRMPRVGRWNLTAQQHHAPCWSATIPGCLRGRLQDVGGCAVRHRCWPRRGLWRRVLRRCVTRAAGCMRRSRLSMYLIRFA